MACSNPIAENSFDAITITLQQFLAESRSHSEFLALIAFVRRILESIPLPSGEYSVATNRVANAERYYESAEIGAATWELRMLRNQLQSHADLPAYHSKRMNRMARIRETRESTPDFTPVTETGTALNAEEPSSA